MRRAPKRRWYGVGTALGCLISGIALLATPARAAPRVVVLVADRLERADLWNAPGPQLARLRAEAAAGLLCTRFLLSSLPESAYVALGAGSWVQYEGSERWRGGGDPEDAAAFWVATGKALPEGALYCRERERVTRYSNPEARPGALGEALRRAGKRTACIGNADLPEQPRRQILALLMDGCGVVDGGDVGAGTQAPDPAAPGGVRCDLGAVLAAFAREAKRADVIAIEFGDTSRLAAQSEWMLPAARARARAAAVARLDTLVGLLRARIDPRETLFLLLSPAPPVVPSATEQVLTPVFAVGCGYGSGLLRSSTTRRAGVVANADLAATIAALLGVGPLPGGAGSVLGVAPHPNPRAYLRAVDQRTRRVARLRFGVFQAWAVLLAPALAFGPLLASLRLWGRPAPPWVVALARGLQLGALSLPVGDLLVAGAAVTTLGGYLGRLAGVILAVAGAASGLARLVPRVTPPFWIAAFTAGVVLLDTAQGAQRILGAMASYVLTEGARFYGIGNETAGVVVGLTLVGLAAARPLAGHRLPAVTGLAGAALALLVGWGRWGANFGGGLTAALTLTAAAVLAAGWKGARAVLVPLAAAALAGVVFVFLDLTQAPEARSHIGQAALQAQSGGLAWVGELVARKAQMNQVLLGRTGALRLYLVALPVVLAACLRPAGFLRAAPEARELLLAGVVGSSAAVFLNDSGVVTGGLILAFVLVGAGYMVLSRADVAGKEGQDCA